MKNTTILAIIAIMLILVSSFVFVKGGNGKKITGNSILEPEALPGEMQKIVLSQEGFNYKDVSAKAGKSIELTADSSVKGCLRAFAMKIEGKLYTKYLRTESDTLQLPALKKGKYTFSCTMGMGFGQMIVE